MARAGSTATGVLGEGWDFAHGKGFSPSAPRHRHRRRNRVQLYRAGFAVIEEMFSRRLWGHGKQLEVAVGKVLGQVVDKGAKALCA